jgi:N-acetylated-alpha-linked acidic dipeptidase
MRRIPIVFVSLSVTAALAAGPGSSAAPPAASSLLGFGDARAAEQRALEARFDSLLVAGDQRAWLERLTARPHHLGSAYGRENAQFMAGLFRSWGYDTAIEEFRVLFPTPKVRVLELLAPTSYKAVLDEPAIAEDRTSGQKDEQLPPYNAYSIDGDVTADLVYVNYGVPADYDELERRGVDVRGKIVIARYGGSWRGIKPKVAAEHGAIGCLIYSDPKDDGYFLGDVYPKGGFRPEQGVQRGSVADMPLFPGDPLTPGVGATADAKRLDRKDAPTLTRIPVLPISYGDARPLLAALGGPMAPEGWRGALPIPYHLGPGPSKVHLKLEFDWRLVPAFDVIAKLAGSERPDEWIVRGNHHDGWVNGANDPISGMVALLAEAKGVGELAKAGFRPKRTIVYAAWDGEEPGLLGSTEWVETHAAELAGKAAVYINTDGNARGLLSVGGSHSLEPFVNEVARDVIDPEKGVSVGERYMASRILDGSADERKEVREKKIFRLDPLGSGSDYTPFLQHLGIASLNLGYDGEGDYGQYHSIYDSFDHFIRFMDPDLAYGVTLAKTGGRLTLRLASADVLPFAYVPLAEAVGKYAKEVVKLADLRQGRRGPGGERPVAAAGDRRGARPGADPGGPVAAARAGAAAPPLVPPPGLRPRLLYRLRGQDPPGSARGDRAAQLEGSGGAGGGDRADARRLRRPARPRHRAARGRERGRAGALTAGPGRRGGRSRRRRRMDLHRDGEPVRKVVRALHGFDLSMREVGGSMHR